MKTVPYRANTFLGFVNAIEAVHGVSQRAVTPHLRRYVDFVCELPFRVFDPPQLGLVERTVYRALQRPQSRAYNPDE